MTAAARSRIVMTHPTTAPEASKSPAGAPVAGAQPVRHFGRFQLLRLLAKSSRTMLWLAADPRGGRELVLAMPRSKPEGDEALRRWHDDARRATRIAHPTLAPAAEVGAHEHWPFIAYERGRSVLMSERIGAKGLPPAELVPLAVQALQGLAFAHEAGALHLDLHAGMLVLADNGACRLLGLGVALPQPGQTAGALSQRLAAERDVLAFGLVMHQALAAAPALGLADVMQAVDRMPPAGRDQVRLPRQDIQAIPDPLRAIVNRATDRQPRQRYRNARSFERALSGWLRTADGPGGGPMALLLDRLRSVGLLPAMRGGAARAARLQRQDSAPVGVLAEVVLEDVGLSFELLRLVNSASVRGAMGAGSGPILTVRRAITLVGLDAVRRAAQVLKPWPGPLADHHAGALDRQLELARRAGRAARQLRPAGYDAELVYLLAMLQRLGRLVVHYHFPEEALQIQRLMQPAPAGKRGEPDEPGMGEEAASFAVLGVDIDALGQAVGRYWGLDEATLQMMRRLPPQLPVHTSNHDADLLRVTASCANELIDAQSLPPAEQGAALHRLAQRFARMLQVTVDELRKAALGQAPDAAGVPGATTTVAPAHEPGDAAAAPAIAPGASG